MLGEEHRAAGQWRAERNGAVGLVYNTEREKDTENELQGRQEECTFMSLWSTAIGMAWSSRSQVQGHMIRSEGSR